MSNFSEIRARIERNPPRRVHEPGTWQAAVALVLVPAQGGDIELLFIRRAERAGDPWSGHMAFPGGRREEGDETLLDTARRETLEETGIALLPDALLGELDDLFPNIKVLPPVVVRPFVFGLQHRPEVASTDEVATHLWASLGTLRDSAGVVEIEVGSGAGGGKRTVEAFVVDGQVIWGMTHRIVSPLLDLLA